MRIKEGPTSGNGTIVAEYALTTGCKPTTLACGDDVRDRPWAVHAALPGIE